MLMDESMFCQLLTEQQHIHQISKVLVFKCDQETYQKLEILRVKRKDSPKSVVPLPPLKEKLAYGMSELCITLCGRLSKSYEEYDHEIHAAGGFFSSSGTSANVVVIPQKDKHPKTAKFKKAMSFNPTILSEEEFQKCLLEKSFITENGMKEIEKRVAKFTRKDVGQFDIIDE